MGIWHRGVYLLNQKGRGPDGRTTSYLLLTVPQGRMPEGSMPYGSDFKALQAVLLRVVLLQTVAAQIVVG
jgi:hypothetical protein